VTVTFAGLRPALATSGTLPDGAARSYEPKWDGFRGMPFVDATVRLMSRRGNDLTYLCPSVEKLGSVGIGPAVLDGQIVAFRDGVQSFEGLQSAMRRRSSEAVAFLAFDVLWVRGISLIDRPYAERRAVLEELEFPDGISITPRFDDGAALFEATRTNGYEGVVAKKLRSRYRAGLRTRDVARPKELENRLQPRQSCPFVEIVHEPGAHFVKPNVTAEIRFLERTSGGRLRHATFRQLGGRWNRASPAVRKSERDNDPPR
jgi:ATP-dependent DNA ligase